MLFTHFALSIVIALYRIALGAQGNCSLLNSVMNIDGKQRKKMKRKDQEKGNI
jgi:hypothetical protein